MAYCTYTDVKYLVKTSKLDASITAIIVTTDADVDDWEAKYLVTLDSAARKFVSSRKAAIIIATSEPEAAGIGDYGNPSREKQIERWQAEIAQKLSDALGLPFPSGQQGIFFRM